MHPTIHVATVPVATRRISYTLHALAIAFLSFDAIGKVLTVPPVVQGTVRLGYPAGSVTGIGVLLLACVVLYAVPRTTILGAVLLTGYLGGAVATHVRVGNPLLTHVLFPTYVAALVWGAVYLREPRLRSFLPVRR